MVGACVGSEEVMWTLPVEKGWRREAIMVMKLPACGLVVEVTTSVE